MSGDRFLIEKAITKIRADIAVIAEDLLNEEDRKKRWILTVQIQDLTRKIRYLEDPKAPEFTVVQEYDYDDYDHDEPCSSGGGICPCCGEHPDRD